MMGAEITNPRSGGNMTSTYDPDQPTTAVETEHTETAEGAYSGAVGDTEDEADEDDE